MKKFKKGDKVVLKTGGPTMVIAGTSGRGFDNLVNWFDSSHELKTGDFDDEILELAPADAVNEKMRMLLDDLNLQVNGFAVMCHPLGTKGCRGYWLRNEKIVIVFNPVVSGDQPVVVGEFRENKHYTIKDIIAELEVRREKY